MIGRVEVIERNRAAMRRCAVVFMLSLSAPLDDELRECASKSYVRVIPEGDYAKRQGIGYKICINGYSELPFSDINCISVDFLKNA